MSGKRVYGRAYPIKQSDAKAYRRVDRSLRANPIGVTAMAAVNGRGSARSARAVAQGKTRSQRIARAESVYKNGEKTMGVLKNKRKTGAAKKKSSSTSRRKVPGTNYYRTSGGRYQNAAGKFVKKESVKSSRKTTKKKKSSTAAKKRTTAKRAPASSTKRRPARRAPARKRVVRKNASVGYSKSYAAGHDKMSRSAAGKKAAATRKRRARAAAQTQGRAKTVGKYKRVRIADPRTGKMKLSYMYETKGGKRRKIPTSAVTRSGHKTAAEIKRGRAKAAARVKREGSAFVANRSGRQKRAGKRLAAYMAAKRSGKTVAQARSAAIRKVPLARGDQFKGVAKAPVTTTKKRTKVRRNKKRSTTTALRKNGKRKVKRRVVRKNAKRRVVRKAAPVKANARRRVRRKTTAKKKTTAKRRKRRAAPVKRRRTASKRRRTTSKRRKTTASKRRRTMRRNGRKGFRAFRKNSFMANLKAVLQTGLFVATGFLFHRITTNLIVEKALATTLPDNPAFQEWKKPLVGLGIMLVGIPVAGKIAPKRGIELGAGMFASFLQSTIIAALGAAGQPNLVSSVAGYGNSRAYALRGTRRRRGVRGMERHATSIMPRYTPVRGYSQAAAGYQQAAAGQFQQAAAGAGEYFTATGEYFTATGEYFAPQGTKGVGGYEPAGELAMQASAGTSQFIRDGLRPDGDIDHALDVAEAAAGLGEAIEHRVGQQSQWIPNNPLWAGERAVTNTQATSELSAGILQRPGGNGILSGG